MSDLVKRLRASVRFGAAHGDAHERSVCERQINEAANEIERLIADNASLYASLNGEALDGMRYRWLRDEHDRVDPVGLVRWKMYTNHDAYRWVHIVDGVALDAAIDAAIKASDL